jgi:hypothetical protein
MIGTPPLDASQMMMTNTVIPTVLTSAMPSIILVYS